MVVIVHNGRCMIGTEVYQSLMQACKRSGGIDRVESLSKA